MFPSLEAIAEVCTISPDEERQLRSPASPIVLLPRKQVASPLSLSLAPGNPCLGAMLPYTPLHHLLLAELGFPVVATSGNLSEEPICIDEHDALHRLGRIADVFLVHNRPIARHVDDSVVRLVAGRELVLRRARGFAPLPVQVKNELPPMIAVGAHQKNAIAASVGRQVFISQHIGDLETAASLQAFDRVIGAFREMYELAPERLVCDKHPAYLSTQYAHRQDTPTVAVQHHVAHVLSCMAENELEPPVLGIAWDGSGYGLDGTVWGGEFLHVTGDDMRRAAHFRTFRLPGNEQAVREPRRVALAVLYETFGDEAWTLDLPPLAAFSDAELRVLHSMLARKVNAPVTSSAGRLFDAIASIAGLRQVCRHEGQAAMELEFAISSDADARSYPFAIEEDGDSLIFDWRPMVRAIVAEGRAASQISARFHNTLVAAGVEIARRIGEPRVVLTGGCFQNKYLTERFIAELRAAGFAPYWHQRVPPNDGGIALGQIVAAGLARKAERGGQDVSRSAR
jgi:hydrogenase maturation protein HypF